MLKGTAAILASLLLLACNNLPDANEERDALLKENLRLCTELDSLKAELDTCDSILIAIEDDLVNQGHIIPVNERTAAE